MQKRRGQSTTHTEAGILVLVTLAPAHWHKEVYWSAPTSTPAEDWHPKLFIYAGIGACVGPAWDAF